MTEKRVEVREVETDGVGVETARDYARWQTHEDNSTVMLFATRGSVDVRVWRSHDRVIWPMNQKRCKFDAVGMEVGEAYNQLFTQAVEHPTCKDWPWILTYEEDNTFPPDAYKRLLTAIRHCPDCKVAIGNADHCPDGHKAYDGISGLYWTKVNPPSPMAFGDPKKHRDFSTQNVYPYMNAADELDQVLEVNAIPMGFSLYRKSVLKNMPKPWFKTADSEVDISGDNRGAIGQDLFFCINAKENAGARFGVHCGVRVGHIDVKSGKVY